jgi:plastocyanin
LNALFQSRTDIARLAASMKGNAILPILAALSLTPAVCLGQATVEGSVDLPKTRFAPVVSERYEIVSKAGVLETDPPRAVVYLEGEFPKTTSLPTKQVGQKDLAFVPPLLPVEVGTKVEFPNFDDTYHNIFSYSPAKRFDLGRYPSNEKPVPFQVFDRAGLVTLRCDIHEHMRGLILVLATPYFTITDAAGHYRLTKLPAGHFVLKAWINSKTTRERPVDLKSGAALQVDLP